MKADIKQYQAPPRYAAHALLTPIKEELAYTKQQNGVTVLHLFQSQMESLEYAFILQDSTLHSNNASSQAPNIKRYIPKLNKYKVSDSNRGQFLIPQSKV